MGIEKGKKNPLCFVVVERDPINSNQKQKPNGYAKERLAANKGT